MDYEHELYHYGILGMKWGIRRYQNPDGTLTKEGRIRYGVDSDLRKFVKSKKNSGKSYAESLIKERPDLLFTTDEELKTFRKTREKVLELNDKLKATANEEFSEVVRDDKKRKFERDATIDLIEDSVWGVSDNFASDIHKISKEEFEDYRLINVENWLQVETFNMRPSEQARGNSNLPKTCSVFNDLQKAWKNFDKNAYQAIDRMQEAYKDVPLNKIKPKSGTYGDIYDSMRYWVSAEQDRERFGGPISGPRIWSKTTAPALRYLISITDEDLDAIITYDEFKKLMKEKYKE